MMDRESKLIGLRDIRIQNLHSSCVDMESNKIIFKLLSPMIT